MQCMTLHEPNQKYSMSVQCTMADIREYKSKGHWDRCEVMGWLENWTYQLYCSPVVLYTLINTRMHTQRNTRTHTGEHKHTHARTHAHTHTHTHTILFLQYQSHTTQTFLPAVNMLPITKGQLVKSPPRNCRMQAVCYRLCSTYSHGDSLIPLTAQM